MPKHYHQVRQICRVPQVSRFSRPGFRSPSGSFIHHNFPPQLPCLFWRERCVKEKASRHQHHAPQNGETWGTRILLPAESRSTSPPCRKRRYKDRAPSRSHGGGKAGPSPNFPGIARFVCRFVFLILAVITQLYALICDDVMFHVEHSPDPKTTCRWPCPSRRSSTQ